jgi:hypothetical protein
MPRVPSLKGQLVDAACWNVDREADVAPILRSSIRAAISRRTSCRPGPCPTCPLRNWGAPWLVREILAARERRLAGHRVEAPPPPRRAPPAIDWDEFDGGYARASSKSPTPLCSRGLPPDPRASPPRPVPELRTSGTRAAEVVGCAAHGGRHGDECEDLGAGVQAHAAAGSDVTAGRGHATAALFANARHPRVSFAISFANENGQDR